jgi:anaerobic selenocysteine-containing dehydrogenase
MHLDEMIARLWTCCGWWAPTPLEGRASPQGGFLVVQDMFLTETAQQADVVLPAASAYEKRRHGHQHTGEVQRLTRAINTMGAKPDLEIMGFIAREMGVAAALGPWVAETVFAEIRQAVRGYDVPMPCDRHRRCGADHAGQRAHSRGKPARSGAIRPQRPVRVRHARAVF